MGWPTTFSQLAGGNQPLSIFDTMFAQVAQMIAIPCTAAGQNSITVSPNPNCPILTSYTEFCAVRFKAVQTSNGTVSLNFLTLPNLPVYLGDGATPAGANNLVLGQEYVCVFSQSLNSGSGGWFLEEATVPAATVAAGSSVVGLVIANNITTPNTKLDVSIAEVTLNNAAGQSIRFAPGGAAFTIDFTVNGINGLDTGAINVNTNYYIYAISNGGVLRGLVSTSTTFAGTLPPTGYTFGKLIGMWRTATGTAQLMGGAQYGNRFSYRPGVAQGMPAAAASGSSVTFWTSFSLANFVPSSNVKATSLLLYKIANGVASQGIFAAIAPNNSYATASSSTTNNAPIMMDFALTLGVGQGTQGPATVPGRLLGSGPFFWGVNGAAAQVMVEGWDVNI